MSFRWTDTLREPLATLARDAVWDRVEPSRDGSWLFLSGEGHGDAVNWSRVAEGVLKPLDPLDDRRLPNIAEAIACWLRSGHGIRLLAWRVGSRAIFELNGAQGRRICKMYRKDRRVFDRWTVLPAGDWRVPAVLDWDARRCMLTLEFCPGTSLNRRWLAGSGESSDGERIADILSWLAATSPPNGFPQHGVEDEARVLSERLALFERVLDDPPPRAAELTARVIEALHASPDTHELLCHRDFHDKQILLERERGHLIDMDLAASGPAALDVGNILAHLRLRALKGAPLAWRAIAGPIAERCVRERKIGRSLHVWTASTLMRLALIYSRRRRAPDLIPGLLASVEQALGRTGEWSGILP